MQPREEDSLQEPRRLADFALALDLASRLADLTTEPVTVEGILDVFEEICAPGVLAYLPIYDGKPGEVHCRAELVEECVERRGRLEGFTGEWAWTPSGTGFLLRIEHQSRLLGVLEVDRLGSPEHKEHYVNLALAVRAVLGLAISNARNFEELERTQAVLREERDTVRAYLGLSEALERINVTVGSTLDFNEIMRRVVVEAAEASGAEMSGVFERRDGAWVAVYAYGYPETMLDRVFDDESLPTAVQVEREGRTIVCHDLAEDPDRLRAIPAAIADTRSVIDAPLILKNEFFGILSFRSRAPRAFSQAQVDFASKLASTVSLALENARLYETEHDIANRLQEALLTLPDEVPGVEYAHAYHSATEAARVGGDFYDLFELHHDHVGVVIGDVAGKGIDAAVLTSMVKNTIRAHANERGKAPAQILGLTNDVIFRATSSESFVTVLFGILDCRDGRFVYGNAGHTTAARLGADGGVAGLAATGPILGAFEDVQFQQSEVRVGLGDLLFLYTDGLTEARRDGALYGEERLFDVLAAIQERDAATVVERVLEDVVAFSGNRLQDDLAILTVKRVERSAERPVQQVLHM